MGFNFMKVYLVVNISRISLAFGIYPNEIRFGAIIESYSYSLFKQHIN